MNSKTVLSLTLLILFGRTLVSAKPVVSVPVSAVHAAGSVSTSPSAPLVFNLRDFGAVGNGVADDGPALQNALNAIGAAGGGELFVPAGRYAIITPVQKNFTGLATNVSILGVESFTPVPPPTAPGNELTMGLNLVSEFRPRTGPQGNAINISGLQNFLIKDIAFMGTPGIETDAATTIVLKEIWQATIRHCEFYGLSSLVGGNIVLNLRSHLNLEQTVFLGCATNSGLNGSAVENIEWKGITVSDTVFVDYGQRAELYGKLNLAAPFSWVSVGNAAPPESSSPRREAIIRNVFFDEGALNGISSVPYHFLPASAPINLIYVSGIFMNVSNLGTSGNYFHGTERVLIEKTHYGWSHNASAAINLLSVGNTILDRVECVADANRILADSASGRLTVIDSVYTFLNSQAPLTRVITTTTPDADPVQYVRQQFTTLLGREPDAAAHFYWSDRLLQCGENAACISQQRAALAAYLGTAPAAKFSISGTITDETGATAPGVLVTLDGSQSVTAQTGADGTYTFANLPTSGVYTVSPSHLYLTLDTPPQTITTPNGNRTVNFQGTRKRYAVAVQVNDTAGNGLPGVTVSVSGGQGQGTTDSSGRVTFSGLLAGLNYTLTPSKTNYAFSPASVATGLLGGNQTLTILGALRFTLSGRVTDHGNGLAGATVSLSGSQSGIATTNASGNYSFNVLGGGTYQIAPSAAGYFFAPGRVTFNNLNGNETADFAGTHSTFEFTSTGYSVTEDTRTITVTVERQGDTSEAAEVTYRANDGSALQRSDVIPVIGRLSFAPGETSKSFIIFITNDSYVEGNESLTLELGTLVGGAPGNNSSATLTIVDNDTTETTENPIDDARFFVRQHYRDFLNRPADNAGLDFWSGQITSCGTNAACIADRRMNVSAAFFLSIEFQETGFLVYRLYQASYAQPPRHLDEFLLDTRTIGQDLIVNAPGWQELLETRTRPRSLKDFVARQRFSDAYPLALTPAEFVDQLNSTAGASLSANDIAAAIAEFAGAATSENLAARARVLRRVAESQAFSQRQLNPAFVLMQYFGYLQRNPSDPPNTNLDGYNFWLQKLEQFGGDFRRAEMVKSFLVSAEYRARFGTPVKAKSNVQRPKSNPARRVICPSRWLGIRCGDP